MYEERRKYGRSNQGSKHGECCHEIERIILWR